MAGAIFNTVPPLAAGAGMKFDGERISTAAAPRNLLDNSDFRNPVNQRGISYGVSTTNGPKIDRWGYFATGNEDGSGKGGSFFGFAKGAYISVKNPAGGYAEIRQNLEDYERMKGKTYTFALFSSSHNKVFAASFQMGNESTGKNLFNGELFLYSVDSIHIILRVMAQQATEIGFVWAALYEGEYTAENLPEYQPKGYGAELAECQRYYLKDCARFTAGIAYGNSNNASVFVPTPTRLRTCQVEMENTEILLTKDGAYKVTGITADASSVYGNGVRLLVTVAGTFSASTPCTLANQVVNLIADL